MCHGPKARRGKTGLEQVPSSCNGHIALARTHTIKSHMFLSPKGDLKTVSSTLGSHLTLPLPSPNQAPPASPPQVPNSALLLYLVALWYLVSTWATYLNLAYLALPYLTSGFLDVIVSSR